MPKCPPTFQWSWRSSKYVRPAQGAELQCHNGNDSEKLKLLIDGPTLQVNSWTLGKRKVLIEGMSPLFHREVGGNVRLVFKQIWNSRQNWCNKAASKRYKVWAFLQNLGPTEIWELKSSSLIKRFAKAQKKGRLRSWDTFRPKVSWNSGPECSRH